MREHSITSPAASANRKYPIRLPGLVQPRGTEPAPPGTGALDGVDRPGSPGFYGLRGVFECACGPLRYGSLALPAPSGPYLCAVSVRAEHYWLGHTGRLASHDRSHPRDTPEKLGLFRVLELGRFLRLHDLPLAPMEPELCHRRSGARARGPQPDLGPDQAVVPPGHLPREVCRHPAVVSGPEPGRLLVDLSGGRRSGPPGFRPLLAGGPGR